MSSEIQESHTSDIVKQNTSLADAADDDQILSKREHFIRVQPSDPTIKSDLFDMVFSQGEAKEVCYYVNSGLCMRKWCPPTVSVEYKSCVVTKIIIPRSYVRADVDADGVVLVDVDSTESDVTVIVDKDCDDVCMIVPDIGMEKNCDVFADLGAKLFHLLDVKNPTSFDCTTVLEQGKIENEWVSSVLLVPKAG